MEKRKVTREMIDRGIPLSNPNSMNLVYKVGDHEILKIFGKLYMKFHDRFEKNLETRIMESKKDLYGIATPTSPAYYNGEFVGYFQDYVDGISYAQKNNRLTLQEKKDLYYYANEYLKLEKIVKAHPNIVFPDLLTHDNVISNENGELTLIDYDGMQIDENGVLLISEAIGEEEIIGNPKYMKGLGVYTKELDIKSLFHWYFFIAFNIDLRMVGAVNPQTGEAITVEDVFRTINLDNPDIMNKVCKVFSSEKNEYLGEDVLKIAEKYDMIIPYADEEKRFFIKKLKRK